MGQAILLSVWLAAFTTLALLVIGVPLAWWLARGKSWATAPVAALVAMPLVLPPTVLGFYLLIAMGPNGPLAPLLHAFGVRSLAFTFGGLVLGSVIYSLPFMVQPVRNAFQSIGDAPLEAAASLRASPVDAFFSVAVPLARGGIISGAILSFAHTIGEFGVVLMIGGNIPGRTQVLSIAIFNYVESLEWDKAHLLSAGMVVFSFAVVLTTMLLEKKLARVSP